MTIIIRQVYCRWCGAELEHKPTGRPREFCNATCRVAWGRAFARWNKAYIAAELAGQPAPPRDFGYVGVLEVYDIHGDGSVTKRARPGLRKGGSDE